VSGEAVESRAGWRARVPAFLAGLLTLTAVICAVAAVSEAFYYRSQPVRQTIDAVLLPAKPNLGYAVFLAALGAGAARRKQLAHRILVVYFGLQLCYAVVLLPLLLVLAPSSWAGHRPPPWAGWVTGAHLAVRLAILAVLLIARRQFPARVQRGSVPQAVVVLVAMLIAFTLLGWALVEAFPGSLHGRGDRLSYAAERVLGGAFSFDFTRRGYPPGWVSLVLGLFGSIALLAALGTLFRSQRLYAQLNPHDELRIRELLAAHGERDSLGYFATRRDKAVVFSPSGKSAVTYRVVAGVSLASGDPLGDPEAWGSAIRAWLGQAKAYAWMPAVMGASEQGATAFVRAGLRAIELGDEAILHVRQFTLDGREMRPVRQAVHRVRRAGYTVRIRRHAEISPDEMARIIDLAARWRHTETERGFSMALGRLGDPADGRCVLVEALRPDGEQAALLSFTPWGGHGLSLDLMRRDRDADNGLVEFLVAALVADAPRLGVERISLNFAVFRAVFADGARIGAGPVLRAWRRLLLFLSRWYQLETLYRSNLKYRPEWVPRFLCFQDVRHLARVAVASGIAEGFVAVPSLRTLLRRGRTGPPIPVLASQLDEPTGAPAEPIPAEPASAPAEPIPMDWAADAVLTFFDGDCPVWTVALDVQHLHDDDMTYVWPAQLASLHATTRCATALVVICPDPSVARWAAERIELGPGCWVQPLVMGPQELAELPAAARAHLDAGRLTEFFGTLWTDGDPYALRAFLSRRGVDVPGRLRASLTLGGAERLPVGLR
jgi:lysyl-tRNA synthetase, class II